MSYEYFQPRVRTKTVMRRCRLGLPSNPPGHWLWADHDRLTEHLTAYWSLQREKLFFTRYHRSARSKAKYAALRSRLHNDDHGSRVLSRMRTRVAKEEQNIVLRENEAAEREIPI